METWQSRTEREQEQEPASLSWLLEAVKLSNRVSKSLHKLNRIKCFRPKSLITVFCEVCAEFNRFINNDIGVGKRTKPSILPSVTPACGIV